MNSAFALRTTCRRSWLTSVEKTMKTSERLGRRRADLEALMIEWEQVSQTIEANR